MMQICVCGWYLDKFDDFYMSLHRVHAKHPVFVVSHAPSGYLDAMDLPYHVRENSGLEWGAYDYFLKNQWDGKSPVLFTHDDVRLRPVVINNELTPPEFVFDKIAEMDVDQAYVFSSRAEDVENQGQHGRMVFCSAKFLTAALEIGGFWFDRKNHGYTSGEDKNLREIYGCLGYNAAIIRFHAQAHAIGGDVHCKLYVPAIDLAKRGKESAKEAYGKWIKKISDTVKDASVRLHVGCGSNHPDGYVNIDLFDPSADVKADAKQLPFADCSADLIEAHHLIEHMGKDDAAMALSEWLRVLKPGGHVFLTCPDSVALTNALVGAEDKPALWDGVINAIYGNNAHVPGMAHRWGYCRQSMTRALDEAGFTNVEVKTVVGYRPTPSLMAIAEKGVF